MKTLPVFPPTKPIFKFEIEEELKDEPKPPYIWAHISCVLFIPELYFGDDIYASNILGLENVNKDRFKYECSICLKRSRFFPPIKTRLNLLKIRKWSDS